MRTYTVFNIAQCEGLPERITDPPPPAEGIDPVGIAEAIKEGYLAIGGPKLIHGDGAAWYSVLTDEVHLPNMEDFTSVGGYYGTLFHELGHSTGHKDRLDRSTIAREPVRFGSPVYSREELVAEMCATFLLGDCYIGEEVFENNAAYIEGWLRRLQDDKKLIIIAAGQGQRAADHIIGRTWDNDEDDSRPRSD